MDARPDDPHIAPEGLHADDVDEGEVGRGIIASGWFRAALLLTAFGVGLMLALPYLLDWFEPLTSSVTEPVVTKNGKGPPVTSAPPPSTSSTTQARTAVKASNLPTDAEKPGRMPRLPARPEPSLPFAETRARPALTSGPVAGVVASGKTSGRSSEGVASHWVQLGSFKDLKNAQRLAEDVREQGFPVQVVSVMRKLPDAATGGAYHLVRAGAFPDQARAATARDDLKARGFAGFLTEGLAK